MSHSTDRNCLYLIRIKATETSVLYKRYITSQHRMWYYFVKPNAQWIEWEKKDGFKPRDSALLSHNPIDAALFANEKNALKAIRDATRRVKQWQDGYNSLPIDEIGR